MKTNYKNNKYIYLFSEQLSKLSIIFLVFSVFFSFSNINQTYAYFSDEAVIGGNTFTAGTLDLSTDKEDFGLVLLGSDNNFVVSNLGSLSFEYGVGVEISNTNDIDFCNQLNISLKDDDNILYAGILQSLSFNKLIQKDSHNNLFISITDPSDSFIGKVCNFDLVLKAWQEELDYTKGFTDIEHISIVVNSEKVAPVIIASGVVLNEIYPNEDKSASAPLNQEFIELYNMSNSSIDIEGWSIGEFAGNSDVEKRHIISSTNTCADGSKVGFARPYADESTVIQGKGLLVIELCAKNRLNDNGDTLILRDNSGKSIDSHSYSKTVKGKSHARVPNGGDWVDPIPTPGAQNTATRQDLEAEGWDEEKIVSVLRELGFSDESKENVVDGILIFEDISFLIDEKEKKDESQEEESENEEDEQHFDEGIDKEDQQYDTEEGFSGEQEDEDSNDKMEKEIKKDLSDKKEHEATD